MSFDKSKLPELDNYSWYDIMGIAANKIIINLFQKIWNVLKVVG